MNAKIIASVFLLVLCLTGPTSAFAATSPSLGTAATYGVLADTFNYNIGLTTVTGTAGLSALGYVGAFPGGGGTLSVVGLTEVNNAARAQAGIDQNSALNNVVDGLNVQLPCTSIGAAVDLAGFDTDGPGGLPPGTFAPGCYTSTGTMSVGGGGTVTLTGAGTFIFRAGGALNTTANSIVQVAGGASACDVFWAPVAATTLNANSDFVGTDISAAGITIGNNVTWLGRALAFGGTVTADSDSITVPSCVIPPPPGGGGGGSNREATINVVKAVINDNGGTKTITDFPLFVNGTRVFSGISNVFPSPADVYYVTETKIGNYVQSFSGDCDALGGISLSPGDTRFCIVTNDDTGPALAVPPVPPLINLLKVPDPLALPDGPGSVEYTYTLTNIGTVPVTDITIVGDTCSPIVLVSGDTDGDNQLDLNETWVHTCTASLTETHTNTAVATGWANGISAIDIASATVIVGESVVPPLIHVTKVPKPFTLLAGGGNVTYTEKVTNPGTEPLSNVRLTDNKCAPMKFISGDTNNNSKLESNETWTYTCQSNLTVTTTNTARANGEANGITVRDFATATVIVAAAVPGLPKTGIVPQLSAMTWYIIGAGVLATVILLYELRKKKK